MPLIPVTRTSVLAWFSVTGLFFVTGLLLSGLYACHVLSGLGWRSAAVACLALTIAIGVHPSMQARRLNLSSVIAIGADSMVAIATAALTAVALLPTHA